MRSVRKGSPEPAGLRPHGAGPAIPAHDHAQPDGTPLPTPAAVAQRTWGNLALRSTPQTPADGESRFSRAADAVAMAGSRIQRMNQTSALANSSAARPTTDPFFRAPHIRSTEHGAPRIQRELWMATDFIDAMGEHPKADGSSETYTAILAQISAYHAVPNEFLTALRGQKAKRGAADDANLDLSPYLSVMNNALAAIKAACNKYLTNRDGAKATLKGLGGALSAASLGRVAGAAGEHEEKERARAKKLQAVTNLWLSAGAAERDQDPLNILLRLQNTFVQERGGQDVSGAQDVRVLGQGANNIAVQINLNTALLPPDMWVWKSEPKGQHADASEEAGIPGQDSRGHMRSVATYRIDQLLRTGVTPETQLATRNGRVGQIMRFKQGAKPLPVTPWEQYNAGDAFHAMQYDLFQQKEKELADNKAIVAKPKGKSKEELKQARNKVEEATEALTKAKVKRTPEGQVMVMNSYYRNVDLGDPILQKKLANMHILDLVTGQLDRHAGNFLIDADPNGRVRDVIAIDNDMAFGTKHNNLAKGRGKLPNLPTIVDYDLARRIVGDYMGDDPARRAQSGITEDQLVQAVQDLLEPAEITALLARFSQVKDHLRTMLKQRQVASDTGFITEGDAGGGRQMVAVEKWGDEIASQQPRGGAKKSPRDQFMGGQFDSIMGRVAQDLRAFQKSGTVRNWDWQPP